MDREASEHIQNEICLFLGQMIGRPCTMHDDLRALGVDSIALLELVIFIENKFKIPLPLELITSTPMTTVAALIQHLLSTYPALRSLKT